MKISRRSLIKGGSVAGFSIGLPEFRKSKRDQKLSIGYQGPDLLPEPDIFPIASKAIDAALNAGASYADVRIIRTVFQGFLFRDDTIGNTEGADNEVIGFGVRALINGCFGFAASPYVDLEEATILAKAAVEQARSSAEVRPRNIEWKATVAQSGRWICPGEDPFVIPIEERVEFINAWREEAKGYRDGANATRLFDSNVSFSRTEKFIATSDGTEVSQVLYTAGGNLSFIAYPRFHRGLSSPFPESVDGVQMQQGGWEVFKNSDPRGQIPKMVASAIENSKVGMGTFDVGRYDLVLDGKFVGGLISNTFGKATQLDLALGYEANATGTSYLGPNISEMLGSQIAATSVSIKCDRSQPGKLATVKWDDEGVPVRDFDIIKDGVLVDYQSSRENAFKVNSLGSVNKSELGFQGCASAQTGLNIPVQSTPNMAIEPNPLPCSLSSMISDIKRGYVIYDGTVSTTFGLREGVGTPQRIREIRNGKLGDFIPVFQIMFSTPEIWKNVVAIGDSTTMMRSQGRHSKGEPTQSHGHSVDAVALKVKNVPVIDPARKA